MENIRPGERLQINEKMKLVGKDKTDYYLTRSILNMTSHNISVSLPKVCVIEKYEGAYDLEWNISFLKSDIIKKVRTLVAGKIVQSQSDFLEILCNVRDPDIFSIPNHIHSSEEEELYILIPQYNDLLERLDLLLSGVDVRDEIRKLESETKKTVIFSYLFEKDLIQYLIADPRDVNVECIDIKSLIGRDSVPLPPPKIIGCYTFEYGDRVIL